MDDPRSAISSLAYQGKAMLQQASTRVPSTQQRDFALNLGAPLLADAFGISRRTTRQAGKAMMANHANQQARQIEQDFQRWLSNARNLVAQVSIARRNITINGNSADQLARLARACNAVQVATKLRRATAFLDSLAGQPLVYNSDIPELLKQRQLEVAQDRKVKAELRLLDIPDIAPGLDHIKFPNRAALQRQFNGFTDELQMIEGAIDAYLGDGPDRYRQALASCRIALESMGKHATGHHQWRQHLAPIADDATRKMMNKLFDFLSSRGAHAGKNPTKADAELGIQQVISCMNWLKNHEKAFRSQSRD